MMDAMSVDIIPAGERGSFRVTDRMLYETGKVAWEAFEVLLREEARRRGLDLAIYLENPSRDYIVEWRPHDPSSGGAS